MHEEVKKVIAVETNRDKMNKRDEFAAAALMGMLAHAGNLTQEQIVKASWYLADAMMEAREK